MAAAIRSAAGAEAAGGSGGDGFAGRGRRLKCLHLRKDRLKLPFSSAPEVATCEAESSATLGATVKTVSAPVPPDSGEKLLWKTSLGLLCLAGKRESIQAMRQMPTQRAAVVCCERRRQRNTDVVDAVVW